MKNHRSFFEIFFPCTPKMTAHDMNRDRIDSRFSENSHASRFTSQKLAKTKKNVVQNTNIKSQKKEWCGVYSQLN